MPTNYFISYSRQSYFGYGKRKSSIREYFILIAIIAVAILIVTAIILFVLSFFFPKDRLAGYFSREDVFYIHMEEDDFLGRQELAADINNFLEFDFLPIEGEMSWAVFPEGNVFAAAKEYFSERDFSGYSVKNMGDFIFIAREKEALDNIYKVGFFEEVKHKFFFGRPSRSVVMASADLDKFPDYLPLYHKPQKENLKKNLYFRLFAKEKGLSLLAYNFKNFSYSYDPLISGVPVDSILSAKGINFSFLKNYEKFFSFDFSPEVVELFSAKGEFLIKGNGEWSDLDYLLALSPEEELSDSQEVTLHRFIKQRIAEAFPMEQKIILSDGEQAIELIADPAQFQFNEKEGIKYLSVNDNFEFAYGQVNKENRNYLVFANSFDLIEKIKQNRELDKISNRERVKECFGFFGNFENPIYINAGIFASYSNFLSNISGILINQNGKKACFY